jgi:hypothetical protein
MNTQLLKKSIKKTFRVLPLLLTFNITLFTSLCFSQSGVAINTTSTPSDPSAILDVSSTNSGILIPRMTTVDRDNNINNPAQGLQIFNLTSNCVEIFIGTTWQPLMCGCVSVPVSPSSSNNITSKNSITWVWNTVTGSSGYKYNTINDYNIATDNGLMTFYNQIGLIHSNAYSLYVWAYNECGVSDAVQLFDTTSLSESCGKVTFIYNGQSVTYGTVNGQNGTCWLDRNLGASVVATAHNHADSYGDLFQCGRLDDGHQTRSPLSSTTTTQSSNYVPGHSNFIIGNTNWYSGSTLLWQGVLGINNPCPSGWRLPITTELTDESASWSQQNSQGAVKSSLHLPAAGGRDYDTGNLSSVGSSGYYWSSTNSNDLRYNSSSVSLGNHWRAFGRSVRCIKD